MTGAGGKPSNAVIVEDGFLSPADCRSLLDLGTSGQWLPSTVGRAGKSVVSEMRRSVSLYHPLLQRGEFPLLTQIEQRLAAAYNLFADRLEPWQITRYRRGGWYDYHLDCSGGSRLPGGERKRSVMVVLEQPARGGATHFRALGLTVRPAAGRLLVWENLLPTGRCNHAMIHAARPVWRGRKTILSTWEHERAFRIG